MTRLLSLLAALLAAIALVACSTDNKNANVVDASSAASAPVDGGLLAAADAPDLDAGMPSDAGDLSPDAGANPVTTAAVTTTNDGGGEKPHVAAGKDSPFDRVLAKPKVQGGDADALKAAVEKKTGFKVALMRKTAGKWFLFQFAPTSKGRTADDQAQLVAVLKSMEEIASAEGDRLMKVKQP